MSHLINKGENTMQHLNGMELVALSIHVDQNRARNEFMLFMRRNWRSVALAVSVELAMFLSIL